MFLTWLQLANDAGTGVVPQDSSLEEQNLLSSLTSGPVQTVRRPVRYPAVQSSMHPDHRQWGCLEKSGRILTFTSIWQFSGNLPIITSLYDMNTMQTHWFLVGQVPLSVGLHKLHPALATSLKSQDRSIGRNWLQLSLYSLDLEIFIYVICTQNPSKLYKFIKKQKLAYLSRVVSSPWLSWKLKKHQASRSWPKGDPFEGKHTLCVRPLTSVCTSISPDVILSLSWCVTVIMFCVSL